MDADNTCVCVHLPKDAQGFFRFLTLRLAHFSAKFKS